MADNLTDSIKRNDSAMAMQSLAAQRAGKEERGGDERSVSERRKARLYRDRPSASYIYQEGVQALAERGMRMRRQAKGQAKKGRGSSSSR